MVSSAATTVAAYLKELPEDARKVLSALRRVIRKNLPKGYSERMNFGMITYEVPLKRYPETYNGQPLCYAGLARQKNHYSLYLMSVYQTEAEVTRFRKEFEKSGKKLDMGKSCVRFKTLEDLPLDLIAKTISGIPVDEFIQRYEKARAKTASRR